MQVKENCSIAGGVLASLIAGRRTSGPILRFDTSSLFCGHGGRVGAAGRPNGELNWTLWHVNRGESRVFQKGRGA